MALQSSGAISLANLQTEYGGANPISISEYYKGAGLVPSTAANANVPTSGQISLSQFYGGSAAAGVTITLNGRTVYDYAPNGAQADVSITFNNNGVLSYATSNSGSGSYTGEWITQGAQPSTTADDYEIYATTTGGTAGTGTTGTWLNLGTTRQWYRNRGMAGAVSWIINFQIRAVGTSTVLGNATITLTAEVEEASCVASDSWIGADATAATVTVGDVYETHLPEVGFAPHPVEAVGASVTARCVRITTSGGAVLRCSRTTPFNLVNAVTDLHDGSHKLAPEMLGEKVFVRTPGGIVIEDVVSVEDIGYHAVTPISFGGRSFAAGDNPTRLIFSHNTTKVIL